MSRRTSGLITIGLAWFACLANQPAISAAETAATSANESHALQLLTQAIGATENVATQASLMRGMLSGLEGHRSVQQPYGWSELNQNLSRSDNATVRDLSTQLSQIFGDLAATKKSLTTLQDTGAAIAVRQQALRSLLAMRNEDTSALLESLLDEPALRLDAIRGYAMTENPAAPAVLLQRYATMIPEHRRAAIETLATRKRYAQALLIAIQTKQIPRDDIPVHVARSLQSLLGDRFAKVYGEVKSIGADREKQIAKFKHLLNPAALAKADAAHGRAVFKKTCAACHTLYDDGGKVGPDLTGSNRANLDYILLNSVDPSYDVPAGYQMTTVITDDGRVINGVVAEEDGTKLILKTPEQPRVVLAKEDIEERKISDKSIMPDGQLDQMKPQEVIDLIKYLQTTQQVELAK